MPNEQEQFLKTWELEAQKTIELLRALPAACLAAERDSPSYLEWRERTGAAAMALHASGPAQQRGAG